MERYIRDFNVMNELDPQACVMAFGTSTLTDKDIIMIQSCVRGFLARKRYLNLLYDKIMKEEQEREQKDKRRVQDTLDMLDTMALQKKINEETYLNQCERNRLDRFAYRIQTVVKFWLEKKKQHVELRNLEQEFLELQKKLQIKSQELIYVLRRKEQLDDELEKRQLIN